MPLEVWSVLNSTKSREQSFLLLCESMYSSPKRSHKQNNYENTIEITPDEQEQAAYLKHCNHAIIGK